MAAPVRWIDQFLSLLSRDTQIYLNTCSYLDCTSSFYPFYDYQTLSHHQNWFVRFKKLRLSIRTLAIRFIKIL
jgi:hypothetical protein